MRKSERIRLLELQLVRLQIEMELVHEILHNVIESQNLRANDLESGKWYDRRPRREND